MKVCRGYRKLNFSRLLSCLLLTSGAAEVRRSSWQVPSFGTETLSAATAVRLEHMWSGQSNVGSQQGLRGRALFDYTAQAPNQIGFRRGQIIGVITFGAKGDWSNGVILETGKLHHQSRLSLTDQLMYI
jgi:SH3 domain